MILIIDDDLSESKRFGVLFGVSARSHDRVAEAWMELCNQGHAPHSVQLAEENTSI